MIGQDVLNLQENRFSRINALDRYRGLAIALMIMFGAAKMFTATDFFVQLSTHDLSLSWQLIPGYGFYDIIAPLFVFASGLAFHYSSKKSIFKNNIYYVKNKNLIHSFKILGVGSLLLFDFSNFIGIIFFVLMALAIILVALSIFVKKWSRIISKIFHYSLIFLGVFIVIINIIETILSLCNQPTFTSHWGPLLSIGIGMLICSFIVDKSPLRKFIFVFSFIIVYYFLNIIVPLKAFEFTHGGILGSLGYALLFVMGDAILEYKDNKIGSLIFAIFLFILSAFVTKIITPSKEIVTLSYILLSFVFCYTVYLIFVFFDFIPNFKFPVLTILGKNSLTAYCLHFALSFTYGICMNALIDYLPMKGILQIILFVLAQILYAFLMAALLLKLSKNKLVIKL